MRPTDSIVSWVHFGDLHITRAGEQNHHDFLTLIDGANRHLAGAVDFAVLPGDNADDGTAAQFVFVRDALDRLRIPVRTLPGDHDFKQRSLDAFYDVLEADRLPPSATVGGYRCRFLDVVSAGSGGPDFRLGNDQVGWLAQLQQAEGAGETPLIFMHTYPADLKEGASALSTLISRYRVACVDMGHTHYNELANDGRTIFAATRSTGQIEEGPVGISILTTDGGVVSWRFKPLGQPWPLVLITSPADHRLITDPTATGQIVRGTLRVRSKVWRLIGLGTVSCRLDDLTPQAMAPDSSAAALWAGAAADLEGISKGRHWLTVRAEGADGTVGEETIEILIGRPDADDPTRRFADGSDRNAIGAWTEKGILGTQLGPNCNGRKW